VYLSAAKAVGPTAHGADASRCIACCSFVSIGFAPYIIFYGWNRECGTQDIL
jgi:hypothetical protein